MKHRTIGRWALYASLASGVALHPACAFTELEQASRVEPLVSGLDDAQLLSDLPPTESSHFCQHLQSWIELELARAPAQHWLCQREGLLTSAGLPAGQRLEACEATYGACTLSGASTPPVDCAGAARDCPLPLSEVQACLTSALQAFWDLGEDVTCEDVYSDHEVEDVDGTPPALERRDSAYKRHTSPCDRVRSTCPALLPYRP